MNVFWLRCLIWYGEQMDDPAKVQHQIELAERAASTVSDQTTAQRLMAFANELRERLQNWQIARHRKSETRARAYELWEQAGKPPGRDEEFWLTAERELNDKRK
jgi:2,3-bisphosphoglycerate-independent phosphoglycerate mutase